MLELAEKSEKMQLNSAVVKAGHMRPREKSKVTQLFRGETALACGSLSLTLCAQCGSTGTGLPVSAATAHPLKRIAADSRSPVR